MDSLLQLMMKHRDTRQYLTIREGGAESPRVFLEDSRVAELSTRFSAPGFFLFAVAEKAGKEVIKESGPL